MILAYYLFVLNPNIEKIEIAEAEKNTRRAKNLFNFEIQDLDRLTLKWANTLDVKSFFDKNQKQSSEFFMNDDLMKEDNIHLAYLVDTQLNPITKKTIDPVTQSNYMLPNFISKLKSTQQDFFTLQSSQPSLSGIYMSERGPMLVSVHSIIQSEQKKGWLIIGRYVTEAMLNDSRQNLRAHLNIWPMGTSVMPKKMKTIVSLIHANSDMIHNEKTANSLNSFSLLNDLSGLKPIVILSATPRNLAYTANNNIKNVYAIILAANFILVLLILKTVNYAILIPAQNLTQFIQEATRHVDAPPRLKPKSDDEFGELSKALNELIVEFCSHKNKVMNHAYRSGASKAKLEIVYDLNDSIQSIVKLVENLDRRLWTLSLHELEKTLAEVKCSTPENFDLADIQSKLNRNNEYIRYEIEAHRNQVRKIKEKILRTATIIKGYEHQVEQSKSFSKMSKKTIGPNRLLEKHWSKHEI